MSNNPLSNRSKSLRIFSHLHPMSEISGRPTGEESGTAPFPEFSLRYSTYFAQAVAEPGPDAPTTPKDIGSFNLEQASLVQRKNNPSAGVSLREYFACSPMPKWEHYTSSDPFVLLQDGNEPPVRRGASMCWKQSRQLVPTSLRSATTLGTSVRRAQGRKRHGDHVDFVAAYNQPVEALAARRVEKLLMVRFDINAHRGSYALKNGRKEITSALGFPLRGF